MAVKPIPDDMHSVTPHLMCNGAAQAIDFYVKAFNAVELARLPGPGGKIMHAMVRIGDSSIMLADVFPDMGCAADDPGSLKGSPVYLHLYVEDVDATMAQAQAAGATITMPATDMFWGDRYGQLTDPLGHRWSVATHKEDLTPEQIQKNMETFGCMGEGQA
ncbi:VOC family protein [Bordetella petrii]|uniref:VOC family protein n=1 Tax=Bordetella petrii TaxID=94624 RepID=UPI001E453642|nr:VOC family protein [Bordetella petrii]MCD0503591.1 VOC family protein [Bordetella petrii]